MSAMCKICLSPYREELLKAYDSHFPRKMLWEKYNPLIWGALGKKGTTFGAFLQAVYKHKKHKNPGVVVIQTTNKVGKDTQGIARMVTELYSRKLETMGPQDVSTKDYVAVNKLVLEEKKLKLDANEQLMTLAKLFGIPEVINPLDVIKEEDAELGSPKDEGNQPQSP